MNALFVSNLALKVYNRSIHACVIYSNEDGTVYLLDVRDETIPKDRFCAICVYRHLTFGKFSFPSSWKIRIKY